MKLSCVGCAEFCWFFLFFVCVSCLPCIFWVAARECVPFRFRFFFGVAHVGKHYPECIVMARPTSEHHRNNAYAWPRQHHQPTTNQTHLALGTDNSNNVVGRVGWMPFAPPRSMCHHVYLSHDSVCFCCVNVSFFVCFSLSLFVCVRSVNVWMSHWDK